MSSSRSSAANRTTARLAAFPARDQLKADIAALQSRFAGSMTLWFSYTLDQCNTNSVSLDVPAVTLGMDNLLVTADKAMDADSRTALEQSAAGQGVQHLVLHSADIFQ